MRSGWNLLALALLFSVAWTPVSGAGEPAGPDLHGEETLQQREARMAWWREAKFGLFVHWGPVSLTGKELSWSRQGPRPSDHQALQEIRQAGSVGTVTPCESV